MKYVYFGTPEFSADILTALVRAGMPPVALVTNPDRPAGRAKAMTPPPAKAAALGCGAGIDILQPERLDAAFAAMLAKYGADVGILAAYGKIVPPSVFAAFPKGIVVVHPSLLPKYRGATPLQAAILAGDAETGTTLFVMDEKVDHGPVIAERAVPVAPDETYATLAKKLSATSAELLIAAVPGYLSGATGSVPQDESAATYTKKLATDDAFVDIEKDPPERIVRMVRALNPEPGAWTMKNGRRMKILAAELADGALVITRYQFAGELSRSD